MFRNCQSGTRIILLRIFAFILTASIGQGLVYVVRASRRSNSRANTAGLRHKPASSRVYVENVPPIVFPQSMNTMKNVDFWIPVSMVVRADGGVEKIFVDFDRATTAQGQSFSAELSRTNSKNASEITSDLVTALNDMLKEAKFTPRTFNGQALPTMVFVDSHFLSKGRSCIEVDSDFKTSEGVFWTALMQSSEHCYDTPN